MVATRATQGDIQIYYNSLGAVQPIYTVTVKSRVDGQLMTVGFKEGQLVHKGDILVEIDPRPYQAALEQAQGNLIRDQALLANAKIDLERYKVLLKQEAIPEQTYATQAALVSQDEGQVKTDQGSIAAAQVNVVYCHITSPIDGVVGLRLVDPGNIVHATDTNGLLVITQIDPISVIFTLPRISSATGAAETACRAAPAGACVGPRDKNQDRRRDACNGGQSDRPDHRDAAAAREFRQSHLPPFPQPVREHAAAGGYATQRDAARERGHPAQRIDHVCLAGESEFDGQHSEHHGRRSRRRTRRRLFPVSNREDEVVMVGVDKLQDGARVNAQGSGEAPARSTPGKTGKSGKKKSVSPSRTFILRPVATSLLMVGILLVGGVAYKQLPVSALPEVDYPTIQVITFYPGASPDVMASCGDGAARTAVRAGARPAADDVDQFRRQLRHHAAIQSWP